MVKEGKAGDMVVPFVGGPSVSDLVGKNRARMLHTYVYGCGYTMGWSQIVSDEGLSRTF